MVRYRAWCVVMLAAVLVGEATLPAYARGGGGVRAQSRSSIGGGGNRGGGVNRGTNVNRNENVNRNTNVNQNVNVNRDVNVNVNSNYYGGGYGGGCCYHPVATAAAVTATAVVTAAVVGSVVNSLPPSCSTVIVNGLAYQQCGSTWYQPQLSGSTTTYVVVNAPR
jgi:hypothetical protein